MDLASHDLLLRWNASLEHVCDGSLTLTSPAGSTVVFQVLEER
jgi:hypothetical protein